MTKQHSQTAVGKQTNGNITVTAGHQTAFQPPGEKHMDELTQFCCDEKGLYWRGCYDSARYYDKLVTPESFAHLAKGAWKLYKKIFEHLEKMQLLKPNDVVCDFMAGTGRTGVLAAQRGYKTVSVELEPHFIKMIEDNKKRVEEKLQKPVSWEILQGDARKLTSILANSPAVGIVSPPYLESVVHSKKPSNAMLDQKVGHLKAIAYGSHKNQIGNLPDNALVGITSPPYEKSKGTTDKNFWKQISDKAKNWKGATRATAEYGNTELPLGVSTSETYTTAMLAVYSEAFKAGISPLVTVTKNPTRKGKLRRLDLDTAALLQRAGYEIIDYHRATLFDEINQSTLTGGAEKVLEGRVSFFKRLSIQKGNVAAKWEDIIVAVNPQATGLAGVTSPPYVGQTQKTKVNHAYCDMFWRKAEEKWHRGLNAPSQRISRENFYSQDPSNIGNLKDDAALVGVVSPPYSDMLNAKQHADKLGVNKKKNLPRPYSTNEENIGNLKDE